MKVYVDLVLLLNFGFDLILIFSVALVLRRKTSLSKILLSALIGATTILAMFVRMSSFMLFLIKIFISVLMVVVAFGYRDFKYMVTNMFYLYTSSILLGGFLYFLNMQFAYKNTGLVFYYDGLSVNFFVLIIFSPVIIFAYVKQGLSLRNNYSKYYNVDIYFRDGNVVSMTGFLDTGNKLCDPYKRRPIILVDKDVLKDDYWLDLYLLVPYDSLNNHGLLKCIVPDKVFISGVGFKNDLLVGVSSDKFGIDGVDCILSDDLVEREII